MKTYFHYILSDSHAIGLISSWFFILKNIKNKLCLSQLSTRTLCKCFTYLTKTRANSTTYSRKPGNFNGTISFEIDIMKNSSPINLNLGQTWLFHICFGCFFCFDLLWRWAESPVSPAEKKCYFGFDMAKIVNFKLSGDEFFMMSTSKIMVPLQSPCFLQYVVEFAIVLTTFVKRLLLVYKVPKHLIYLHVMMIFLKRNYLFASNDDFLV